MAATIEFAFNAQPVFGGIAQLEKRLEGLNDKVSRFSGIDLGSMLGAASLAGAAGYIKSVGNEMSAVVDSADRLRSTPETIQRVAKAAEILGGTDLETLTTGLDKLTRTLIEEPESGLAKSLADLGFSSQAFLTADLDEKLFSVADAFAAAQSKGTALPLLTEALGKGFSKMIPTLQTGRAELQAFFETTGVISNQAALQVDALNDRFDILASKASLELKKFALFAVEAGKFLTGGQVLTFDQENAGNAAIEASAKEKRQAEAAAALREASNQKAKATFEAATKATDAQFESILKTTEAQARLDEDKRRAALDEMSSGKRIATLHVQLAQSLEWEKTLRQDFVPDAERIISAESRSLALRRELNGALKEHKRTQEQTAEQVKREADEAARANEQRRNAVMNTKDEFDILKAKQTRSTRDDDAVQRGISVRRRREQLMKENGMGFQDADAMANQMTNMEDRAANGGRAPRIRGVGAKHMMSGLSSFYNLQRGPSAFDRLQGSESAFDRLQRTPSAFDQLQAKGTADRLGPQHAANASEPSKPASLDDALQKVLTLLPKGIADALMGN